MIQRIPQGSGIDNRSGHTATRLLGGPPYNYQPSDSLI